MTKPKTLTAEARWFGKSNKALIERYSKGLTIEQIRARNNLIIVPKHSRIDTTACI